MDVEAWLQGLERYIAAFRNNEIDWEVLPRLTSEDLREIGVAAIRHRRKLLDAIAALGAAPSPDWRSGQADELVGGDNSVCCDSPRRRGEKRPTPVNRIEERYPSKTGYLDAVRGEAQRLVDAGYLLAEDLEQVVSRASQRYELLARAPASVAAD